ncbi:MAG: extracellular solute-binding protein [Saccharofermentans sp.]|nr:extracellular solute-binding protein [Saccharofermentans sp.]
MRKLASLALCTLIMAATVVGATSCTKGNDVAKAEIKYYKEGIPWWDDYFVSRSNNISSLEVNSSIENTIFTNEEYAVIKGFSIGAATPNTWIYKSSYDGTIYQYIDLEESLDWENPYYESLIYYEYQDNDYCLIPRNNADEGNNELVVCNVDWHDQTITEVGLLDNSEILGRDIKKIFTYDDKLCYLVSDSNKLSYVEVDAVGKTTSTDFKFPSYITSVNPQTVNVNGNELAMLCYFITDDGYELTYAFITYNLSTDEYKELPIEDGYKYRLVDSNLYLLSEDSLSLVNSDDNSIDEVMNFHNTYINGNAGSNLNYDLLHVSDDKIVLGYQTSYLLGNDGPYGIITLTPAQKNPNEGKMVVSVAILDSWYPYYKELNEFNRSSKEYYYEIDDTYDVFKVLPEGYSYSDYRKEREQVISQLMVDIESGNGPDIVLLDSDAAQMEDSRYLLDLNEKINSDSIISKGDFLPSLTNSERADGAIYNVTYGIEIPGLIIKSEYLENSPNGLTYDAYNSLINDKGLPAVIGEDDKLYLFDYFFTNNANKFFDENNKLNLNNEEFSSMLDFVSNLPDHWVSPNVGTLPEISFESNNLYFNSFLSSYGRFYDKYTITGMPSLSSSSLSALGVGVGITACCPVEDGAWQYVRFMLSKDVQKAICASMYPVNNDAFREYATNEVLMNNSLMSCQPIVGEEGIPLDVVDSYMNVMKTAEVQRNVDSGILRIMNEEIQAYFAGQKSLDQIIPVIEDRVNKLQEERA